MLGNDEIVFHPSRRHYFSMIRKVIACLARILNVLDKNDRVIFLNLDNNDSLFKSFSGEASASEQVRDEKETLFDPCLSPPRTPS